MERDKILVNFRTFKTYKDGLDKLAAKRGFTVTQYINHLIFDQIKNDLMIEADTDAKHLVILNRKLPDAIFYKWEQCGWNDTIKNEIATLLGGKDKASECLEEWLAQYIKNIKAYCKVRGFEENEVEFTEIMKAFSEKVADHN